MNSAVCLFVSLSCHTFSVMSIKPSDWLNHLPLETHFFTWAFFILAELCHTQIYEDNLNTSLAAPGALAQRLQRRTSFNTSPPILSKMADGVLK